MSDVSSASYLPDSPYPGIPPFSYAQRKVFFSREEETRTLIRLVVMYRGVLLYAESGTGKSSLVNAGLIPRAIAEGFQPETIRLQPKRGEEIVVQRLSMKEDGGPPYRPSIFVAEQQQPHVALSLDEFLEIVRRKASDARPLLIFDQFEEWITLFEDSAAAGLTGNPRLLQREILEAMVALLNDRELPVKLLIVLREDYLAKLAELFERSPSLRDHYLQLTHLNSKQIYRTIRGAFEKYPGRYRREISPSLAKNITTQFEERSKGAGIRLTEVQIVCKSLYEGGDQEPSPELRFQKDGVQGILESYLESALASLPEDQRDPAVGLLTHMLTPSGTRKRITQDDLLKLMHTEECKPKVVEEALASLVTKTLVRREPVRDVHYYEIASEFLVEWIRKKGHERKLLAAAREAVRREQDAAEQRKRQYEQRVNKWLQIGVAVLIGCLIVMAALMIVTWQQKDNLDQQLRYAQAESLSSTAQGLSEQQRGVSLLLAVAAARMLPDRQPPVPAAEQALWHALSGLSGLRGLDLPGAGPINAVAFSPDGRWLATASADGTARVRDVQDPDAAPAVLPAAQNRVRAMAISPDGRWLASRSDDGVARLWNVQDPAAAPDVLGGNEAAVSDLAFSPDGRWLATGRADGTAWLWDLTARDPSSTSAVLPGHQGTISSVVFSPDGHWLGTASADNTARLWDMQNPVAVSVLLRGHEGEVRAMAISPDGRWLATGSTDNTVRLWDVQYRADAPIVLRGHQGTISAVAFSPDGRWLASGSDDKTAQLWDMQGPAAAPAVLRGHQGAIYALAFSPDSRWLATGSGDGTARLWDMQDPAAAPPVLGDYTGYVIALAFSPDGRWLTTAKGDGTARRWDLYAERLALAPIVLTDGGQPIRAMAVSPDGRWLAAGGDDRTIGVWDLQAQHPTMAYFAIWGYTEGLSTVAFSPDGHWLATGSKDTTVQLWPLTASGPATVPVTRTGHISGVTAVAFSPDGHWLATGSEDKIACLWSLTPEGPAAVPVRLEGHTQGITALAFSPDGRWLATASGDGTARLWNLGDLTASPSTLQGGGLTVAFSLDSKWLATGSQDGTACLWDVSRPLAKPTVLSRHRGIVTAVVFSPGGRWLVTASGDGTARLWDLTAGDPGSAATVLGGHTDAITAMAFSLDGRWLVTGSEDSTARKWDLTDENRVAVSAELSGHEQGITTVAVSQDGRWLITGSRDGTVRLWTLRLQDLIDLACSTAGRPLSSDEQKQYTPWREYQAGWPCPMPAPAVASGRD